MSSIEPEMGRVSTALGVERRKPLMERVIDPLATGLGNSIGFLGGERDPIRRLRGHLGRRRDRPRLERGHGRRCLANNNAICHW